jgi:hypothetical protein
MVVGIAIGNAAWLGCDGAIRVSLGHTVRNTLRGSSKVEAFSENDKGATEAAPLFRSLGGKPVGNPQPLAFASGWLLRSLPLISKLARGGIEPPDCQRYRPNPDPTKVLTSARSWGEMLGSIGLLRTLTCQVRVSATV